MPTVRVLKIEPIMARMHRLKKAYEVQFTKNTTTLIHGSTKYLCSEKELSFADLAFIQKVKSTAKNTNLPKVEIKKGEIEYFNFSPTVPEHIDDIIEVDVNAAYWKIALDKGYINKEVYGKGLEVEKSTRLVALGSLATSKRCYEYDPKTGKSNFVQTKKDEVLRSYFFDISRELGFMMSELTEEIEEYFFFWVDAIFVPKKYETYVRRFFHKHNLEVKTKKIISARTEQHKYYKKLILLEEKKSGIEKEKFFISVNANEKEAYYRKEFYNAFD